MMPRRPAQAILVGLVLSILVSCTTQAALDSAAAPSATASLTAGPTAPRTVELELDSDLLITEDGQQVSDIPVTPGETIHFVITNTAGFDHDLYIGSDEQLSAGRIDGLPGVPPWSTDVPQEFDWVVPEVTSGLKFGCTLRGHYPSMQGTFSVAE